MQHATSPDEGLAPENITIVTLPDATITGAAAVSQFLTAHRGLAKITESRNHED